MLPFLLSPRLSDLGKGQRMSLLTIMVVAVLVFRFTVQLYQARMKFRRLQSQGIVHLLSHRKES